MKKKIIYILFFLLFTYIVIAIPLSSSSINWLSRKEADSLYCAITDGCGDSTSNNNFDIYFNHSIKSTIHFYINESDVNDIHLYTTGGNKFIFGEDFE